MKRKLLSILLSLAMVLTMFPASSFADGSDDFCQTKQVDGVIVEVSAPAGVFPEGAALSVLRVKKNSEEAEIINEAVGEVRDKEKTVSKSYAFDIKVLDTEGNEVQPDTRRGNVAVRFTAAEAENSNLDTNVYHVKGEAAEENLTAEQLESRVKNDTVAVETEGFSYYVVEFTYTTREYRASVAEGAFQLSTLLEAVDLEGEIQGAVSGNTELLTVTPELNDDEELTDCTLTPIAAGSVCLTVSLEDEDAEALHYEITILIDGEETTEPITYKVVNTETFRLGDMLKEIGLLTFITEEDREAALQTIQGVSVSGVKEGEDGTDYLSVTRSGLDYICEPMDQGLAKLTVEIGDSRETAIAHDITVTVAYRDDTEIEQKQKEKKEIDLSKVPDGLKGNQRVALGNYEGDAAVDLTVSVPEVEDREIADEDSLEDFYYEQSANTVERKFMYNGEKKYRIYSALYQFSDDALLDTGVEGLQIVPFAALVGKGEKPVLTPWFYNGQFVSYTICNDLYESGELTDDEAQMQLYQTMGYAVANQYYLFDGDTGDIVEMMGLQPDRDLLKVEEPIELEYVYGYMICDADYNCGYEEIGRSGAFTYTKTYEIEESEEEDEDVTISFEGNETGAWGSTYLYTTVGKPVDLLQGYSVEGEDYTLRVKDSYNKKIDFTDPSKSGLYPNSLWNPVTNAYDKYYYSYYYEIEVVDNAGTDQENVVMTKHYCYLRIYPEQSGAFFSLNGPDAALSTKNLICAVPGEKYVKAMKEDGSLWRSDYCEDINGEEIPVLVESTLTSEVAKHFYRIDETGKTVPVDPSWVEWDRSFMRYDDGEYDCPYEWEEEDDDKEKEFYLIFNVGDPDADTAPEQVAVELNVYREYKSSRVYFLSRDEDRGYYAYKDENIFSVGDYVSGTEVKELTTQVNNTDFWLYQYLEGIKGNFSVKDRFPGGNSWKYFGFECELFAESGISSVYNDVSTRVSKCGYYDEEGEPALYENCSYSELPVKVIGSLDLNKAGVYNISLVPEIDGIADAEFAFNYRVTVLGKQEKAVAIDDASDTKTTKNIDYYKCGIEEQEATADVIDWDLMDGISGKTEYENMAAAVTYEITDASGKAVTTEELAEALRTPDGESNIKEGDVLFVTYTAEHPKDSSVTAKLKKTITIRRTGMDFSGLKDLTVTEGKISSVDAVLLNGVKTVQAKKTVLNDEQKEEVVVVDTVTAVPTDLGGFTTDAKAGEEFTITYSAVHPETGFTCTGTRKVTVQSAEEAGSAALSVKLAKGSVSDFVLGGAGQGEIQVNVTYEPKGDGKEGTDSGIYVYVNFPYGFQVRNPGDQKLGNIAPFEVVGGYEEKLGTTLGYHFSAKPDLAGNDYTVIPHLEILYPALEEGYDEYAISAQSYVDAKASGASDPENMRLVFSATNDIDTDLTLSMDGEKGIKTYTTTEFFGDQLGNRDDYGEDNPRSNSYTVTINKTVGKLPSAEWDLAVKLPKGMELSEESYVNDEMVSYPYRLTYYDKEGEILAYKNQDEYSVLNDGILDIPLYNDDRYSFDTTTVGEKEYTYMDIVRAAAKVELTLYFSMDIGAEELKVNLPGAENKVVMQATEKVKLYNGTKDPVESDASVGVILLNGTDDLGTAASGTSELRINSFMGIPSNYWDPVMNHESEIAAGTVGVQGSALYTENVNGSIAGGVWNVYQHPEMTITYPCEYSPISLYAADLKTYDVTYCVSDKKGPVSEKQNVAVADTGAAFDLENGEYVSSVTIKWKGTYQNLIHNWDRYTKFLGGDHFCGVPFPTMNVEAKATDIDGTPLTQSKTVTVKTTAKDDTYTVPAVSQDVTINPAGNPMEIYANDRSVDSQADIAVGNTARWNDEIGNTGSSKNGMTITIKTDSKTRKYTNPVLIITGEALKMVDFTAISGYSATGDSRIVGYATDEKVTTAGPWNEAEAALWVKEDEKGTVAALAKKNFEDLKDKNGDQIPVTGILLDISDLEYGGKVIDTARESVIAFNSLPLWASSPFFDVLKDQILTADRDQDGEVDGYAILSYSVGFHSDDEDINGVVKNADGKTSKINAGRVPGSIKQSDNGYTLDPFAGDMNSYDLSYMELVHVNTVAGGGGNEYGEVEDCTTVFTSDGTEKGAALLSLAEGLSVQGDYKNRDYIEWCDPQIESVTYYVVNAEGKTEERTTTDGQSYWSGDTPRYYYSNAENDDGRPAWFYPFELKKGEYVSKVVVNWYAASGRTLYPAIGLVRVSALPVTTGTGYTLTAGEQLPVQVDMSYSAWTSEEGTLNHLIETFTSAKMGEAKSKAVTEYTAQAESQLIQSDGNGGQILVSGSTPKQGESFCLTLENAFAFSDDVLRLGSRTVGAYSNVVNSNGDSNYNKLHYTVYYRIDKNFEYVENSVDAAKASATYYPGAFSDGDGLLRVVYNGYNASEEDDIQIKLRVLFSASAHTEYHPVKTAYLDLAYDVANSKAERGYNIVYGEGKTVSGIEGLAATVDGITSAAALMKADVAAVVTPSESTLIAVNMMPTVKNGGSVIRGDVGSTIVSTAGSGFGVYCEVISELGTVTGQEQRSTEDWEIYIPLPRSGKNNCEYDLLLAGAITGLTGAEVTYTKEETPEYNALTGGKDGADYTAETSEWTKDDWNAVTAIHICIPKIEKGAPKSFTLSFEPVEKAVVGDLTAYCKAMYNYKYSKNYENDSVYSDRAEKSAYGAGGVNEYSDYGTSSQTTYSLTDYFVSGVVWNDANADGIKDEDEKGLEGVTVTVTKQDGTAVDSAGTAVVKAVAVTAGNGVYKVAMPKAGEYILTVSADRTKLPEVTSGAEAYDLTTAKQGELPKVWSWAAQGTGKISVKAADTGIVVENTAVETLGTSAADINIGFAKNSITANDFTYGIDQGNLTDAAALKLAGASCRVPVAGGQYTIDATQLSAINEAIQASKTGKFPLTIKYTPYAEAESAVSIPVTVYLRENGSTIPTEENGVEYITAQNFSWTIGAAELTDTNARKLAFVSAKDSVGAAYKLTKITVDAAQLKAINDAAMAEGAAAGQSFDLTFTTPGNAGKNIAPASVTVKVALNDSDVKKGKVTSSDYLTAKNLEYKRSDYTPGQDIITGETSGTPFTAATFIKAAAVSGVDPDGYGIESTELAVNEADLTKLNKAFTDRKPGTYSVRISHTNTMGTETTEDDVVTTVKSVVTVTDSFKLNLAGNGNTNTVEGTETPVVMDSVSLAYGANSYTLPENKYEKTKDGIDYRFTGWATSAKGSGTYTDKFELSQALINSLYSKATDTDADGTYEYTLYAAWERIPGTGKIALTIIPHSPLQGIKDAVVSIYCGGISVQDDINVTLEDGKTITDAFEKLDPGTYTVKVNCGYYSAEQTVTLEKGGEQSLTFRNVGEQSYSVTFDLNGGTNLTGVNNAAVNWKIGTSYTMPAGQRDAEDETGPIHWQLVGTDKIYAVGQSVKDLAKAEEAIVFKAIWNTKVIFEENGGNAVEPQTVPYKGTITMPACERENYTLLGWKEETGGIYPAGFETGFNGRASVTLTAQWKERTNTVTFDANGGDCVRSTKSIGKDTEKESNQTYGALPVPTHDYATAEGGFLGWFTQKTGGEQVTAETTAPVGDITLYAHWNFKNFTVTENGTVKGEKAQYGTAYTFTIPEYDATKDYTVAMTVGGKAYTPLNNEDGTYTVPGEDVIGDLVVTSTANTENQVTVTYMFEGKAIGSTVVQKGGAYPVVSLPTKTGYDVTGWYDAAEGGNLVNGTVNAAAPVTILYAHAACKIVTVNFKKDGAAYGDPSVKNYGEPIDFPAVQNERSRIFVGWNGSNGVFIPAGGSYRTPAESVTFTAVWQQVGSLIIMVKDTGGKPVPGVPVHLIKGGVVVKTADTDENGKAVFTELCYGAYNAEAVTSLSDGTQVVTTVGLDINTEDNEKTVIVPAVKFNTQVDSKDMNVTVINLDKAISEEEKPTIDSIANGSMEVIITLNAKKTTDDEKVVINGVEQNIKIKDAMDEVVAKENAKSETIKKKLIEYVNLTVEKETRINNISQGVKELSETEDYQLISVEVTEALYKALASVNGTPENILIYHMHNGITMQMKKVSADGLNDYNGECYAIKTVAGINYIVIKVKNFSTYAFGVQNSKVEEEQPVIPDNRGGGGGGGATVVKTFKADLKLVSADDPDTTLAGAVYELYKVEISGDALIQTVTTDRNGEASVEKLEAGDYYWIETRSPSGYTLDTEKHTFTIKAENAKMTLKNKRTETPAMLNGEDHYAYIVGYQDGCIHPEGTITRAEAATIFFRLLKDDVREANLTNEQNYRDVYRNYWYTAAIATMSKLGILKGRDDGTFGPNDPVTRAEFAVMAARFDGQQTDGAVSFTDTRSHWAKDSISRSAELGWITGYEDGSFKPENSITRAEAITMINRVMNRIPEATGDLLPEMMSWPDNQDQKYWYYMAVQEASNSHYFDRKDNGHEVWTALRDTRDWTSLQK